jgi:glutathione synthase
VSRSKPRLKAFLRELDGPAVIKPLAPRGGEQVFYLRRRQVSNLNQIISAVTKDGYTGPNGAKAGSAVRGKCDFGPVEARICDILRPKLLADGLTFVAVDIVGDRVLELNVFTPGGIHAVHELYEINVADIVMEDLERRVRLRAAYRTTFDPEAADVV